MFHVVEMLVLLIIVLFPWVIPIPKEVLLIPMEFVRLFKGPSRDIAVIPVEEAFVLIILFLLEPACMKMPVLLWPVTFTTVLLIKLLFVFTNKIPLTLKLLLTWKILQFFIVILFLLVALMPVPLKMIEWLT